MARARVYRTEAIVLHGTNFGEADRILTLFTLRHGKLRAIAKGVRRPTSRQGGNVELFSHVDVLMAVGRELDIVTQSEVRESFRALREDLERTSHAYYLAELIDRVVEERLYSPELFALMLRGLGALNEGIDPRLVLCQFQIRLMHAAGFGPELFHCLVCRAELEPQVNYFWPRGGGMLCPSCAPDEPAAYPLSLGAFKIFRHLRRTPLPEGARIKAEDALCTEALRAMRDYVERVLERRLRSPDFIARVALGERAMAREGEREGP